MHNYTQEELAEEKKAQLEELWSDLKQELHELQIHEKQLELERMRVTTHVKEIRMKSVYRVLEYLNGACDRLDKKVIETYLTHCMNKLNGNLDELELNLNGK